MEKLFKLFASILEIGWFEIWLLITTQLRPHPTFARTQFSSSARDRIWGFFSHLRVRPDVASGERSLHSNNVGERIALGLWSFEKMRLSWRLTLVPSLQRRNGESFLVSLEATCGGNKLVILTSSLIYWFHRHCLICTAHHQGETYSMTQHTYYPRKPIKKPLSSLQR